MLDDKKERELAVDSFGENILVSASAGSGKTYTMMQKISNMVTGKCVQLGNRIVNIEKLMIVTFTKAVAKELREEVIKKLLEKIKLASGEEYEELRTQMENIPLANISTLHSFCSNMIRQYFNEANVDPSFVLLEDGSSEMYLSKAISKVIKEEKSQYNPHFEILYTMLKDNFSSTIKEIYDFARARVDCREYLEKEILKGYTLEFDKNPMVLKFIEIEKKRIENYIKKYEKAIQGISPINDIKAIQNRIEYLQEKILYLENALKYNDLNKIIEILSKSKNMEKLPSVSKTAYPIEYTNAVEASKNINSDIKDAIDDFIEDYSIDEIQKIKESKNHDYDILKCLIDIVLKVDEEYSKQKQEDNVLDFNDLEQKMVLLLNNEKVQSEIREKFEFVFVDEYQDINPLQEYILNKVSSGNNMFMVGDVKQSIYGFRQSDSTIFLNKMKEYKDKKSGLALQFNKNFRSLPEVLDFVNEIFNVLMSENFGGIDYKKESQLITDKQKNNKNANNIKIAILDKEDDDILCALPQDKVYSVKEHSNNKFKTKNNQGKYIVREINKLIGTTITTKNSKGELEERPLRYGDICILSKSTTSPVPEVLETIASCNIPIDVDGLMKKNSNNEIQLLISYLSIIDNPKQDIELVKVLLSVFGDFEEDELVKIRYENYSNKNFYSVFYSYGKEDDDKVDKNIKNKINKFVEEIRKYRFESKFTTVDKLLNKIIIDKNFDEYVLSLSEGISKLSQVRQFISTLNSKSYNVSLSKFLYAYKEYSSLDETTSSPQGADNSVKTATIHASKGLQYPVVFLICSNKQFYNDNNTNIFLNKEYGAVIKSIDKQNKSYTKNVFTNMMKTFNAISNKEESMRVLYVALTRPETKLYIVGEVSDSFNKNFEKEFLDEYISEDDGKSFFEWIQCVCRKDPNFANKYLDTTANEINESDLNKNINGKKDVNFEKIGNSKDEKLLDELKKEMEYEYPYLESTNMQLNYSVTQLNHNESEKNNIKYVDLKKDEQANTTFEGVAYHRVMELIDYDEAYSEEDVKVQIDNMLDENLITKEQYDKVDYKNIFECVDNPLFRKIKNNNCLREAEFKIRVKASEILDTNVEDKIMVQGVIDLFIPKSETNDENILIDFKYSNSSDEKIKETYKKQIDLYTKALEICRGQKVDKKYIYVLGKNRIIEF